MPNQLMNQAEFKQTLSRAMALPLLVMAVLTGVAIWQVGSLLAATRWVDHTDQVLAQARLTQKQITDMQSGLRGYSLTHDPQLLQRYTQAHTAFAADEKQLEHLTADNPTQQQRLASLRPDYARWFTFLQQNQTLPSRDYLARSRPSIEALRHDFDALIAAEESQRNVRIEAAQQLATRSLIITLGLALLLGLFLAGMNRRQLMSLSGSYEHSFALVQNQAEALQDSVEQFRATFEQAAIGIAQIGADFQWQRVNQKLCEILGYKREELLQCTFEQINHPDDQDAELVYARQMLAGKIQTYSLQKRNIHKDGSVIWVNLTVSLIRHASGEPKYFLTFVEDITERKRLENQLLQAQKLESIGRLAGGIAHDFNNLLTAIIGYAELAEEECALDETGKDYLANVKEGAAKAANLTRQLLSFARRQVIEPKIINLNDLILSLDKMLRRLIGDDIELVMLPEEELHSVKVDPGQFEQILVNLVVNARDAIPNGGKITIETYNAVLDADYCLHHDGVTPGAYVVLAVSDTGTGIEEAIRLHIFEPFFTTKEKGRGTGLGLATVYGIVKQAGGHIWFYSEPGEGTTFKIYLPRTTETMERTTALPSLTAPSGGSEIILLVEDEPSVRTLAVQTLRKRGYTVLEAMNGEEALRLVKEHEAEIDLLITDVVMPQMSGKELAERLQSAHPDLKVLYASGYTENTIVHHGVLEPGIAFLSKPFTPTVLAQRVREMLDN